MIVVLRNVGGSFSMKRNNGGGHQLVDNVNLLSFLLAGVEGVQHPKDMNDLPVSGADKCVGSAVHEGRNGLRRALEVDEDWRAAEVLGLAHVVHKIRNHTHCQNKR